MESLWPQIEDVDQPTPKSLLREQAKHLGEQTKNQISGEIEVSRSDAGETIELSSDSCDNLSVSL